MPLKKKPEIVRFDPDYTLLAEVSFNKPRLLLDAQLIDWDDVVGRMRAADALGSKDDKKSVELLGSVLREDPFYGVRIRAAKALAKIRTPEALAALIASVDQPDARAREAVMIGIGAFYRREAERASHDALLGEKNPLLIARAVQNLGKYPSSRTRKAVLDHLNRLSYRGYIARGAIQAIHTLQDPAYIKPLQKTLPGLEKSIHPFYFTRALNTLGHIAKNEEDRSKVRRFVTGYVNHPRERIQIGALRALGTLGDPAAIPVVQSLAGQEC